MELDKRFALVRDGTEWYAAPIDGSFRLSRRGQSRDAHGQALRISNLTEVAKLVLREGMRMRCSPGNVSPTSLDLESRGVTGYRLDPAIAAAIGVPAVR